VKSILWRIDRSQSFLLAFVQPFIAASKLAILVLVDMRESCPELAVQLEYFF